MDSRDIPADDLFRNYRELHIVNNRLGGYRITLDGLAQLSDQQNKLSVLDIGCGGGDMLKEIAIFGRRKKMDFRLKGIDLSSAAIAYARKNCIGFPEIEFLQADAFDHLKNENSCDVCTSTLFFHHFPNEKIIELLQLLKKCCRKGFIINDLERNPLAYYSIKLLTQLFSQSYLVRHDAPLSVLRSFKKKDWHELALKADVQPESVKWMWAFRYLLVFKN
ncbi:MAG: methyltransferase domain-containing protein [Chitinophagales bacterium]|nr:methyltransferase domain-containing protein [Chitinophagales bacterium]